jgi:hypothetical protein
MKRTIHLSIVAISLGAILSVANLDHLYAEDPVTQSVSKTSCYTCRMHKQIKESKPGKCPVCKMALVPCSEPDVHEEAGHKHDT